MGPLAPLVNLYSTQKVPGQWDKGRQNSSPHLGHVSSSKMNLFLITKVPFPKGCCCIVAKSCLTLLQSHGL